MLEKYKVYHNDGEHASSKTAYPEGDVGKGTRAMPEDGHNENLGKSANLLSPTASCAQVEPIQALIAGFRAEFSKTAGAKHDFKARMAHLTQF